MIDETKIVHITVYDDEYEEWFDKEMTIADCLDAYTDEGCPNVIERPKGEWIEFDHGMGIVFLKCSRCGEFQSRADNHSFCPNCGADMRGGE